MSDGRVYDGHTFIFGMDMDTEPSALAASVAAKSVNRVFRGGRNRPRPPFMHRPFDMDEQAAEYENVLRFGNFQGWHPYRKRRPFRDDGILVAIAGHFFFLTLVNERFLVRYVYGQNDPKLMHTWFAQLEEWGYIQNGKDNAIFWDGLFPSSARRADPEQAEMPVGTLMAVAHGRVFLSNAYDQVIASDIIFGDKLTSTSKPQKFTENLYPAEGGYFASPTELGPIKGMIVVPRQDKKLNGQGELLIVNEDGGYALNISELREKWKDADIQTLTLAGRGATAPASLVCVNNDVWFKSYDGISSYQISRADTSGSLSLTRLSRAVNPWLETETEWLTQFASSIYFDNRLLTTVHPQAIHAKDESHGMHRFHRGILSLDLDKAGAVQGDSGFNWDGLWTGIRPCALLKMNKRAFAFSFDEDGENRVYEIGRGVGNDIIDGKAIQPEWFYITKKFDWSASQRSNSFDVKKLVGGQLWVSDVRDRIEVKVDYRPDNIPCWFNVMAPKEFGSDLKGEWLFSQRRAKRMRFETPQAPCLPGADYPVSHGAQHQFMVSGKGLVQIDRMRVAMAAIADPESLSPDRKGPSDDPKSVVDCIAEDDYSYSIAASR